MKYFLEGQDNLPTPSSVRYMVQENPELATNKEFVLEAVGKNAFCLQCFGQDMRDDEDVAKAVLNDTGLAFGLLSPRLRANKEFALKAVSTIGSELANVGHALKSDPDVVLAAVNSNYLAIQHADPVFKKDKTLILHLINRHKECQIIDYISPEFRDDRDVVMASVLKYGLNLRDASERLRKDKEIVYRAILEDEYAIDVCSKKVRNIVEAAQKEQNFSTVRETASYLLNKLLINKQISGIRQEVDKEILKPNVKVTL